MTTFTKSKKPYFEFDENGVTIFQANEKYGNKSSHFTWKDIDYIDINCHTLFPNYAIQLKI